MCFPKEFGESPLKAMTRHQPSNQSKYEPKEKTIIIWFVSRFGLFSFSFPS